MRQLLGFVCFTRGGGHQDRTEHDESYSMGHMDAIHCTNSFLKQSISSNDFGHTGLGHTHIPSFTVWYEWCVFLGSGFATGHVD